jgi:hypothetical protein
MIRFSALSRDWSRKQIQLPKYCILYEETVEVYNVSNSEPRPVARSDRLD